MAENPISIKLIALGNSTVGKTSYLIRNTENKFIPTLPTIGYNILTKTILLENGKKVNIRYFDTSGQERYHSLAPNFIKNSDGIILMYDITDRDSFEHISKWWNDIMNFKNKDFPVVLVGNKSDLEDERMVQKEEGENIAKEYNIKFFETSNKEGINVKESSTELISMVLKYNVVDIKSTQLSKEKTKKSKCLFSKIKC